jgi:hypothetical protein
MDETRLRQHRGLLVRVILSTVVGVIASAALLADGQYAVAVVVLGIVLIGAAAPFLILRSTPADPDQRS